MDIRQLKYFVTVVEEKTVTAAAKKLNMTQPPLPRSCIFWRKNWDAACFATREGGSFRPKAGNICIGGHWKFSECVNR